MSLKSKAGIAKTGTTSLRATIPEGIVAFLEMQAGDVLDWKMDIANGERIVIIHKANRREKMNEKP